MFFCVFVGNKSELLRFSEAKITKGIAGVFRAEETNRRKLVPF